VVLVAPNYYHTHETRANVSAHLQLLRQGVGLTPADYFQHSSRFVRYKFTER
jgi:hypothetical protein